MAHKLLQNMMLCTHGEVVNNNLLRELPLPRPARYANTIPANI
jgi:hypothetical protein